jgi:hypothetical protein
MCGRHSYSMDITDDVRKYAAEHAINGSAASESGMQEKGKEFVQRGTERRKNLTSAVSIPIGLKDHNPIETKHLRRSQIL